ncbi:MEDS domain-containing protein [Halobacterium rubrum]|uniref:MEDS domain-containing protein n=1 Tax=Halobacterium TaxID=2239 RepID=UPI001F33C009|nr:MULTISPECIES: MEDS domain-containing protein [Halobacterium]MDH5018799.1 MEDS domain-containing protein [Halobacterium rubrum]
MTDLERSPGHDHFTHVYSSRREQFETVVPYLQAGLEAGDKCVYVASQNTRREVLDALEDGGIDVETALAAGDLAVYDSHEVFPEGRDVTAAELLDILQAAVEDALADGYDRVRSTGEMSWLRDHDLDAAAAAAFEDHLNDIAPDYPWVILCQYHRDRFSPSFLDEVLRTHPQILRAGTECHNEYYRGPDAPVPTEATIDRKLQAAFDREGLATAPGDTAPPLVALANASRQLVDADRPAARQLLVDAAADVLSAAYVAVWTFDAGNLEPAVSRTTTAVAHADPARALADVAWTAFEDDEPREFSAGAPTGVADATLSAGVAHPVGPETVLLVATEDGAPGLSDAERTFLDALAATARTALARRAAETELDEHRAKLSTRTERADRLRRITAAFRRISRAVVDATTTDEVLASTCEALVDVGDATFAWVGTFDAAAGTLTPAYSAGDERGYLDAVSVPADWVDREPTGRAAQTTTVQREATIRDGPALAHWQKHALRRGFQSVVSLPLAYDEYRYGALSVYSDAPGTFDEEVTEVLDEVTDLVAYVLSAVEQKRALVDDAVTELDVRVRHGGSLAVSLAERTDCELSMDGVTSDGDSAARLFLTVRGMSPEAVDEVAKRARDVESAELVAEGADHARYECVLVDESLVATLLDHGASPTELTARDDAARFTVQLPRERSVRKLLDVLTEQYPETELLARRDRNRSPTATRDFPSRFEDELSERQLEILEAAYFGGYFEWPREQTGEDVADSMGVTQPTVNRHLRAVQRTLFAELLEDG